METIRQLYSRLLSPLYSEGEIADLYRLFVAELCRIPLAQTYFCKDTDFTPNVREQLQTIALRLAENVPYQHLLGYAEVGGLRLKVSPDVLIPRPETEELVEWVVRDYKDAKSLDIIDLGTGSGYLAVALAEHLKQAHVSAVDISAPALVIAAENARFYRHEIQFYQDDMLHPAAAWSDQCFDVIVSNPPYICDSERVEMDAVVLEHEPHTALFVPDSDPLRFYKALKMLSDKCLRPGGSLYMEINERFGAEVCALFPSLQYDVELAQDIFRKDRIVKVGKHI